MERPTSVKNRLSSFLRQLPETLTRPRVIIFLSIALLLVTVLYTGSKVTIDLSDDSDALIYPYLFQNFTPNDMVLPAGHSNIIKFPLFLLQSVIPYSPLSYAITNISLIFLTVIGIWLLTIIFFGKRYSLISAAVLSGLLLASDQLVSLIASTTIRNIEYPIGLLLFLVMSFIVAGRFSKPIRPKQWALIIGAGILFILAIAGDTLLLTSFALPALIGGVLLYYFTGNQRAKRTSLQALGYAFVAIIAGYALLKFLDIIGVYDLTSNTIPLRIVEFDAIGLALSDGVRQLLTLCGAWIFNVRISPTEALYFVNFFFVITGVVGLVAMGRTALKSIKASSQLQWQRYFEIFLVLSALLTFCSYVFSNLAVARDAAGTLQSSGSIRYLTLMPFLLMFGTLYLIRSSWVKNARFIAISVGVILVSILLSNSLIRSAYNQRASLAEQNQTTFSQLVKIATTENVDTVMGGYWITAPMRYYSDGKLSFYSTAQCRTLSPGFNMKKSYYAPSPTTKVTMVITERSGFDKAFWEGCSNTDIFARFGTPRKSYQLKDTFGSQNTMIDVFIYDYDLRQRVNFLPQ